MKRAILTVAATVTGLVLLLQFKSQPAGAGRPAAVSTGSSHRGTSSATGSPPHLRPTHHPVNHTPSTLTATGHTVLTAYGPVQVRVTETAGHITDITALQLPYDNPRSAAIAAYAAPRLRREAIAADGAQINVVSGATYTSDGYAQSLQSALDSLHA